METISLIINGIGSTVDTLTELFSEETSSKLEGLSSTFEGLSSEDAGSSAEGAEGAGSSAEGGASSEAPAEEAATE